MNKTRGSQSPICQFLVFTEVTTFFFFVSSLAAEEAADEHVSAPNRNASPAVGTKWLFVLR